MKTTQELYNLLPSSWDNLKLKDYQKIHALHQQNYGNETFYYYVSALSGESVDDLQNITVSDVQKLSRRLAFITNSVPEIKKKSVLQWKKFDEVKFNDFITYENLCKTEEDKIQNMHFIIKAFSKKELSLDEVLELSTTEVFTGFFLLQKHTKRFLNNMKVSLKVTLAKQKIVEAVLFKKIEKA